MRPQSTRDIICALLAPTFLIGVAALQMYRAHTLDQTQWKGGGFGMFSTHDSTNARFLRTYLIVDGREYPVVLPSGLERKATRARAIPTQANIEAVAASLADETWVSYDFGTIAYEQRYQRRTDSATTPGPEEMETSAPDCQSPRAVREGAAPRQQYPRFRVRNENEAQPQPDQRVDVQAIRVELWRYGFEKNPPRLVAWKHAQSEMRPQADS